MPASVSIWANPDEAKPYYSIKIDTDTFEVNVEVPFEEASRLSEIRQRPWASGALRLGTCVGAPAWWCVGDEEDGDADTMSILVGHDDQTWDLAFLMPVDTIDAILREIEAVRPTGQHE